MSRRAQISLQFDDADLFDNFVTPYKEGRLLNSLIIKCLSAYYYNEDVRAIIEGTDLNEATGGSQVQSTQSICDSIRSALLMQDFLSAELQNTIDNGTSDISDILDKTNNLANETGVSKTTESEYGSTVLRLSMENLNTDSNKQSNQQSKETSDISGVLHLLVEAVGKLAKDSGNNEVIEMLATSSEKTSHDEVKDEVKNDSFSSKIEVPIVETENTIVSEVPISNTFDTVEDVTNIYEEVLDAEVINTEVVDELVISEDTFTPDVKEDIAENNDLDASQALSDLYSSLF